MIAFLTVIHVIVSFFLILVVLLQQGKSQDFASTFGGGGTQTAFGARGGGNILTKLTTVAAALFMITSMSLTILISQPGSSSVIDDGTAIEQPATPQTPPAVDPAGEAPAGEEGEPVTAPEAEN